MLEQQEPDMTLERSSQHRWWLWGLGAVVLLAMVSWVGCLLRQMHHAKEFERCWRSGDVARMNSLLVGEKWIMRRLENGSAYYTLERAGQGHKNDMFYDPKRPGSIYISPSNRIIPHDLADFWEFRYYYLTGRREILVSPNEDIEGRLNVTIKGIHVHHFFSGLEAVREARH